MYCDKCGAVLWHDTVPGAAADRGYCHKCDPPEVKLLPLEGPAHHDISPEDLSSARTSSRAATVPAKPPGVGAGGGPSGLVGMTGKTGSAGNVPVPSLPQINKMGVGGPSGIVTHGVPILTVYEDLPKNAAQGAIAYIETESAAYVFDGDDWQNLGAVARSINGKDAKCDRRAAVAATKAKSAEEDNA